MVLLGAGLATVFLLPSLPPFLTAVLPSYPTCPHRQDLGV